jgi:hypothetical protein
MSALLCPDRIHGRETLADDELRLGSGRYESSTRNRTRASVQNASNALWLDENSDQSDVSISAIN